MASIPADEAFSRMRADGDEDSIASFRKRLHFVGADGALEMDIDVAHAENGPDVFVQTLARKTVAGMP